MTDETQAAIHDYLSRLKRALRLLPKEDREAIVAEIESHITDCIAAGTTPLFEVLESLGTPEELAASYIEQYRLADAIAGSKNISLLFIVLERASRSLLALTTGLAAALLYVLAISFAGVAALKPILPGNVGMWVGPDVFVLGAIEKAPAGVHELLGYWIIPVSIALAVLSYLVGAKLMRFTGRRLLHKKPMSA